FSRSDLMMMSDDSDDEGCNCMECYAQPARSFQIKEGKKEPARVTKTELQGIKRGFYLPKIATDDAVTNKRKLEAPSIPSALISAPIETQSSTKPKLIPSPMAEVVKLEKDIPPETHHEEEKIDMKCTKCIESSDTIDVLNQGAFRVTCTDGCILTMHRNCFEKALGSGKKKELKWCVCPTDDCGCSVTVINHRIPGRLNDFVLWLRCEAKECERPKKEEKGKEVRKKDEKKEKDKYKKDRREEEEGRRCDDSLPSSNPSNCAVEEKSIISLALPKQRDEDAKKNLVKPLPADLKARPMERKEDALMNKYAVKETTMKENRKKNKKEVRVLSLPGLTVKGQRGKKEEEDAWNVNDSPSVPEEVDEYSTNGVGMSRENNEMRYEDRPFGFAMPEEVEHGMIPFGNLGRNEEMASSNIQYTQFHHPLPSGHGGLFRPAHMAELEYAPPFSSQPLHDYNGRSSLSGFTESPFAEEPPLIENPHDYPTLERDSIQARKELLNFFETHTPVLEENAALFDSSQIDLDQLKNMLENFIEFQFYGGEEEKKNLTTTLHSIFGGEVESDIIPFLLDLQCFKCGFVDGKLVVSVKTEGKRRREREEQTRRENEEEERRMKYEEERRRKETEDEEKRREERKKEEVRRAVMELEERRKREIEEREAAIIMEDERQQKLREERREEEERRARDKRRKEEEERRQLLVEEKRKEEEKNRRAMEEMRLRKELEEEESRKTTEKEESEKLALENEKKSLEEKMKIEMEEEEEGGKGMEGVMGDRDTLDVESMSSSKKDSEKRAKEKQLERKTREAISTLRTLKQSKDSSNESSPERLLILKRGTGSSSVAPLPLSSSSSSSFSTSAPPFVPRCSFPKAELNPNAPAFVPTQPAQDVLVDENGKEVDKIWIEVNKQILEKNNKTIDELNLRIAELEEEKGKMEEKAASREMEMQRMNGSRINEETKKNETIEQLQSRVREMNDHISWKDKTISQISLESEKKSEELNKIRRSYDLEMEDMRAKIREATSIAIDERRNKEDVMEISERKEEERKREILKRKTACAKEAVIQCTYIINRLAVDSEAQVMASLFVDLRKKWIEHHSIVNISLEAVNKGEWIDWEMALSLEEPSMPSETNDLVKECYVWHYQTMHILSLRLAAIVKKCLIDHRRYYEDAYIIGIIQKWMRIHKDPTKIDATVPQVANMVAQAMGDTPLMPPKYVYVSGAIESPSRVVPLAHVPPRKTSIMESKEPKGWKKASDKVRQVDMHDHECSICLEDTEGGDISYCETFSCNEPYHNECLDKYWKTGGRNCPRCRTPMPPRDAFPALN
ncbi:hypothetical protein PMAYCL1PPCAC_23730, partial [Pristionchus mayeri]